MVGPCLPAGISNETRQILFPRHFRKIEYSNDRPIICQPATLTPFAGRPGGQTPSPRP